MTCVHLFLFVAEDAALCQAEFVRVFFDDDRFQNTEPHFPRIGLSRRCKFHVCSLRRTRASDYQKGQGEYPSWVLPPKRARSPLS